MDVPCLLRLRLGTGTKPLHQALPHVHPQLHPTAQQQQDHSDLGVRRPVAAAQERVREAQEGYQVGE